MLLNTLQHFIGQVRVFPKEQHFAMNAIPPSIIIINLFLHSMIKGQHLKVEIAYMYS